MTTPAPYDVNLERIGEPEAIAWLDAKIEHLRALAREPPPEYLALGDAGVQRWNHKFLIQYGKVLGALETLGSFHLLSAEAIHSIEARVKLMVTANLGLVTAGVKRIG
jgi:hypothetical protein